MLVFYASLSSCLAVLPPGNGRDARQRDTTVSVQIAPNPSQNGQFHIGIEGCHPEQWIEVRVLNVIGRPVLHRTVSPTQSKRVFVDLGHLPKGMYMLEVVQGPCKYVRRIMYQ